MKYQLKKTAPIVLSMVILLVGTYALVSYYDNWTETAIGSDQAIVEHVADDESNEGHDLQEIIHEAQKSVVQIETTGPFGTNLGSGFVYNDRGDIITNAHVVKDADSVYVKTSEAHTYPGAVIGIGNSEDIAVVRVPQLANSSTLEIDPNFEPNIGDEILAVGSPHGFQNTVTLGHLSGTERDLSVDEQYDYNNLYQISANITDGNSGGPLIHEETGRIIGINTAATNEGTIGFSIPISQIYERVSMWSDTANDDELSYDGDPTLYQDIDPNTLEDDSEYLISYFYETLNVRDYFTAYSLLGSELQSNYSYQEFRELIVHSIDIDINSRDTLSVEDGIATFKVNSDHEIRTDEDTRETHHFETIYEVGYENDQLKILNLERELLSKTSHSN
ncbi:S1C family serine protease [Alkalibacillus haloalkaliphilus]|uniref:Peptidase S1 n=1 Tax=Alkalibacillus haloalkaliphilus TaxID=94136 RepID=A0A511W2N0_9BACI|nr:trypsin-like peptidase domain-containing protein [Alkalibacillus haloalkaliphilus]GEN45336.1 peptidase S1 [Alkalibacillus haloalkaliphilus]